MAPCNTSNRISFQYLEQNVVKQCGGNLRRRFQENATCDPRLNYKKYLE
jgi:hypothetical protein